MTLKIVYAEKLSLFDTKNSYYKQRV